MLGIARGWKQIGFSSDYLRSPPKSELSLRSIGVALACELANDSELRPLLPAMLESTNDDIRIVAARWAADHDMRELIPNLAKSIQDGPSNFRALLSLIAAKQHLEGGKLDDEVLADSIEKLLSDSDTKGDTKRAALNAATTGSIPTTTLAKILQNADQLQVREAIYLLMGDFDDDAQQLLIEFVDNDTISGALRADALVALDQTDHDVKRLLKFCSEDSEDLRRTAMRLLMGATMGDKARAALGKSVEQITGEKLSEDLRIAARILKDPPHEKKTTEAWAALPKGDKDRGRRLFHNTRLVQCSNCHVVSNRGANIGPQLTGIAQTQTSEQLLESIIHPSARIAPQYQPWIIVDEEGRVRSGYHLASKGLVETFVDANGKQFRIAQKDIQERVAAKISIMPEGLIDHLTEQEVADLLAFLGD